MLNSPQHFLTGLASNYPQGYTPQGTQHHIPPFSTAVSGFHPNTILGCSGGRFDSTMMQQGGGSGFGMVARAALMPTPTNQHTGSLNGNGAHHPPPHPHHPVSLGLEVGNSGKHIDSLKIVCRLYTINSLNDCRITLDFEPL